MTLAEKYRTLMNEYDLDPVDSLNDMLNLLEKFAPKALENEIRNVTEYLESWKE